MLDPRLSRLGDYPFDRLRVLLAAHVPPAGRTPVIWSVGEPRETPPPLVGDVLARHAGEWNRYPPVEGTAEFRDAAAGWLQRRFALAAGAIDPETMVLPLAGTREGLFLIAAACVPEQKAGGRPVVAFPNPFYHVYAGAAAMTGAEAAALPATAATGFLPDLDALSPDQRDRLAVLYLCSPANPQGAVADEATLAAALRLVRDHDALLVVDECYADIYDAAPPPGALAVAAATGALSGVVVFQSLSKRSGVPGLRSGFVAGDPVVVAAFRRLRAYAGATVPLPVLAVSAALWRDDDHAEANRARYRARFDLAERLLGERFGAVRPAGGFFLWLPVPDDESAATALWTGAALRTLPGRYLGIPVSSAGQADPAGVNPGAGYLRIALVDDLATTERALSDLAGIL